jgi:hypothetical protein
MARHLSPSDRAHRRRLALLTLVGGLAFGLFGAPVARAQPFVTWANFVGNPTHGYVDIPHSPALNPTGAFTFEAWVAVSNNVAGEDCRSIAGKNFLQAWWIGQCNVGGQPTLRSYLKGGASARNGGILPRGVWTHIAVTFDGVNRRHFINGELAAIFAETGPLSTSGSNVRLGSDVSWQFTPAGGIDEVRLWNVARTQGQIRAFINQAITTPQPGLVAVWALNGTTLDVVGPHDGVVAGSGVTGGSFAALANCLGLADADTLCLNNRFLIHAQFRTGPAATPVDGDAFVGPSNAGSGIFWFFSPNNWEVMIKAINGCGLNSRHWIFSAATTNVFYRVEVLDVQAGRQKIYFNFPGPPAPAVTDTDAFATCP